MGKVALKLRVMPTEAGINMDDFNKNVVAKLPDYANLISSDVKPIAFGLKALQLQIIIPDQSPDEIIELIRSSENVENVEIDELSLI